MKAVFAGVVLGLGLTPVFVQAVPQSQGLTLAPVPHFPVDGYRPIRRVAGDGNALVGDEVNPTGLLPVFRDSLAIAQ